MNEFNLPTYTAFIDYLKAFDMVYRNKLWQILALKGFPQPLTRQSRVFMRKQTL
jgi:hypothetical protein